MAANASSVLDLFICYKPLFDSCKHFLSSDEFAKLFTGAPFRGHVPVITRLERSSITDCWEYHVWPWTESRVSFIRKLNKERYDECSSYRPLSISSHISKTLEKILPTRIKSHLDVNGLFRDEQEGIRSKRNATRLLYRLHLMLENAKRSRLPTVLLNIDIEMVLVVGFLFKMLEHKISGKMYQIMKPFENYGRFHRTEWIPIGEVPD